VTEFSHDPLNLQIDFNDTDDNWYAHRMYAWNAYTIWLVGERRFFTEITALDAANINIGSIVLDNTRVNTAYQSDVINIYNDTSTLPVLNPTTGGGGITLYSGGKVLLTSSGGIAPSEAQIKTWLREELAVEMARIDVATSTRLAAADYVVSPTLVQIEASTVLAKEATLSTLATATAVSALPTLVQIEASTVLAKEATVDALPTLAEIEASTVLAKATNVATLQASVDLIPVNPLLTTDTRLNNIDVATSTRLAAADYVAPANADIAAIKAKTDTLVNTDISTLATAAAVTALGTPLQAADYVIPPTAAAIATQVELSILTEGDGQAVLQAIADKIGNENVSAAVIAAQVRTELTPELARIDVASSTLATADNLVIVNDGVKLASLLIPHSTDLA
jgi:hypothetical protein